MFVKAWEGKYRHLGNWATSRVEGFHHVLKGYISTSTCDVPSFFKQINNSLEVQHKKLSSELAEDKIKRPIFCSINIYSNIAMKTLQYSLRNP